MWEISADLERFKKLTTNHAIIMGRKTFESIGHALPQRTNIVLSRSPDFTADGCTICSSLEEALGVITDSDIFIIGGGEIYSQALPLAGKLYLTIVDDEPEADTFFPDYENLFTHVNEENSSHNGLNYRFVELTK